LLFVMFLFQADDGIRDRNVTGVQTCALPISSSISALWPFAQCLLLFIDMHAIMIIAAATCSFCQMANYFGSMHKGGWYKWPKMRSEERRVGKEWKSQRKKSDKQEKKNDT